MTNVKPLTLVLQVRNQLMDSSKLHKDIKNSAELGIYYQICKLKV